MFVWTHQFRRLAVHLADHGGPNTSENVVSQNLPRRRSNVEPGVWWFVPQWRMSFEQQQFYNHFHLIQQSHKIYFRTTMNVSRLVIILPTQYNQSPSPPESLHKYNIQTTIKLPHRGEIKIINEISQLYRIAK